jgi:hypothetical protein
VPAATCFSTLGLQYGKPINTGFTVKLIKRLFALTAVAALTACSTSQPNLTAYDYQIKDEVRQHKRVIIADVNFGKPSRLYLQKFEGRVDEYVKRQLKNNGYKLVSNALFREAWNNAQRKHGNPYNASTGQINDRAFKLIMHDTFTDLKARDIADAVIFTDLIEVEVQFGGGMQHIARWHGVSRKPSTQGPGDGVPTTFNWAAPVDAASLWVNIFDMDLQLMFQSAGGIQVTEAIDLKASSPKFVRRRTLLANGGQIQEAVDLAFHPLIPMKNYPAKK